MNQPGTIYRHTGKINFRNTIISLIFIILFSAPSGYIYAWTQARFPYDPLNGILGLLFTFWQVCVCALAIRAARVRSKFLGIMFGFIASISGLYFSWLFWVSRLHPSKKYYLNPVVLWEKIRETYKYGVDIYILASRILDTGWQKTNEINAILEAFAVTFLCILAGYYSVKCYYYCEKCQAWLNEDLNIAKLKNITDAKLIRQALQQGSIAPLSGLAFSEELLHSAKPEKNKPFYSTRISLSSCPQCKDSNLIKGDREKLYISGGRNHKDTTEIIPPTYLSRQQYNTLLEYFIRLKEDDSPNEIKSKSEDT